MDKEVWCIDAETDPFKRDCFVKPFIWGAYNGSEYHEFERAKELVEFLSERDCVVYAHNGGKFDYHFLFYLMEPYEPVMVIAGRLAKFRIGLAEFRDSYNILPMPLSAYQKDEIDYGIFTEEERKKPSNMRKIKDYLRKDCIYLWDFVTDFIGRYGFHLTTASAAMATWRTLCKEKAPKTDSCFYEELGGYYFGGRVEVFRWGELEDSFKVVDINSAYPYAMKHLHPYGKKYTVGKRLPKTTAAIQRCFITLSCVSDGAFPLRQDNGSLVFPSDGERRQYHVTGWEYLAAVEIGTLKDVKIEKVIKFSDSIRFDTYVDHFFNIKNECKRNGDKSGYLFAKLFLNSLYGKFAANPEKYNEFMIIRPQYIQPCSEKDGWAYSNNLGPWALMQKPLDEEKQRFYNVATAASITGFVRAYLFRAIKACKGVIYSDTDSIACESTGELELDSELLGAWDVEVECEYGAVAGKKLYAFKTSKEWYENARRKAKDPDSVKRWKIASKGVRFTHNDVIRVARGETVRHMPDSPTYSLKRGVRFTDREIRMSKEGQEKVNGVSNM
jgi:hypothetical protein